MRKICLLGGILGLSAAVASASASVQFSTVINAGDTVNNTGGDNFLSATDVVVAPDGSVGISAALTNSGNSDVIYATPNGVGGWNNQSVVEASTPTPVVGLSPTAQFGSFDNIALTSNSPAGQTMTFAASAATGSNAGILQWDSTTGTVSNVAFDGDGKGYSNVGSNNPDSGGGIVEMQVNGSGQVIFPAIKTANPPASQNVIVEGNSVGVATVFTSNGSTLTNSGDPGSRLGIGTDGTGAALLTASGTPGIYPIPVQATPKPLSGTYIPSNLSDPILGYASGGGFNGAVMLVNAPAGKSDIVLETNGGTPQSIVAGGPFDPNGLIVQGQMTPNGQVALYVPSTTGDTIQYADATSGNPSAKVIASIGSALADTTQTIQALDSPPGLNWGPEINSGGSILFQAKVGTSSGDEQEALLLAIPNQTPEILLEAGQEVDVDGNPVTVDDMSLNDLSDDYNYYKNAINDQNDVAVEVDYTDQNGNPGSAVLETSVAVPEPTTIGILSLASVGLMARRRRRNPIA